MNGKRKSRATNSARAGSPDHARRLEKFEKQGGLACALSISPDLLRHAGPMVASDPPALPQDRLGGGESQRAADRDSLFLLATLSDEAGMSRGQARVRNLSATGLMADCEICFSAGDRLIVNLRGIGEVAGTVAWATGNRIGMKFDLGINPQAARKPVTGQTTHEVPAHLRPVPGSIRFRR